MVKMGGFTSDQYIKKKNGQPENSTNRKIRV